MDELELAWAAGLFDGEGHTGVQKQKKQNKVYVYPLVQVVQADREVLDRFATAVGVGSVYGPFKAYGTQSKPTYHYRVTGKKARVVIDRLTPYLGTVKRLQAQRVLATGESECLSSPSELLSVS